MKNVEQLRKEFETLVHDNITREGIDNLLDYLNTSDFYRSPASTKYHGSYAGGLVEHSINVYYSLVDELTFILGKEWEKRYSKETVTIVSLFHDICKIGRYKPGKRNVKDPVTGQWHEEPTYFYNEDYESLPIDVLLGASYRIKNSPLRVSLTLCDLNHWNYAFLRHACIGVDLILIPQFYIAAGYNARRAHSLKTTNLNDNTTSAHGAGWNIGAGLLLDRFKVNFSYGKYHVNSSSLMFNLAFNF